MKKIILLLSLLMLGVAAYAQYAESDNFDKGWLFLNSEASDAEKISFNDTAWRNVDLPHDWAIEGPFSDTLDCRTGALPIYGTSWYRKHFALPEGSQGKVVRLEFEGAMYDSHVWVNGHKVGHRPYGYIGFEFDITDYLNYDGQDNVVAVRLDPKKLASRWYSGAGIYRSVWLKVDEPIYVDLYGTYITTPTATAAKGVVQQETTVVNKTASEKLVEVRNEYFDPEGNSVASTQEQITIAANGKAQSMLFTNILEPKIWDIETPNLYSVVTTISEGGVVTDTYNSRFGIRSIRYDVDGFYLNNKLIRFNGVCLHHDNGALGAAIYRRADERKLEIMKDMGVNAIRTSHNPPSRTLLELCDQMGFVVLDEAFDCWALPKVENGYNVFFEEWGERDLQDMILRDRNHPSIIMWSIGNEIMEQWDGHNGWKLAKKLNDVCKATDPSRPTTAGFNSYPTAYDVNMAQQVDIAGANYKPSMYSELHKNYPEMPLYGSETSSCVSTRGVYHFPIEKYKKHESLQVTSYDLIGPVWAYPPDVEFYFQALNPRVMGEFIWTGFDYLGETTPYGGFDNETHGNWSKDYPSRSSYFGAVDMAGFPKDRFFLYKSQWNPEPMIHLMPHWNWEGMEGDIIPVYCYTNCDEAELFVNGESMGRKVKGEDKATILIDFLRYEPKTFDSPYRLSWDVPYVAGEIKVVGYKDGEQTMEKSIKTAGKPKQIKMEVDREVIDADGRDLAYVTISILDKDGNICPLADNRIELTTVGAGDLIATDNGDPTSVEPFQTNKRKAFNGLALGIIRSQEQTGQITLKAKSRGLKGCEVVVETK